MTAPTPAQNIEGNGPVVGQGGKECRSRNGHTSFLIFLLVLTRRGFVAWMLVPVSPFVITVLFLHSFLIGPEAVLLFVLFVSGIAVFGVSAIATFFLKRSNRFMLLVSTVVTLVYAFCIWVYTLFIHSGFLWGLSSTVNTRDGLVRFYRQFARNETDRYRVSGNQWTVRRRCHAR